ncbi:hypothetical protein PENTCL1PPCAC_570, partial [Pristionchus entomophagus]
LQMIIIFEGTLLQPIVEICRDVKEYVVNIYNPGYMERSQMRRSERRIVRQEQNIENRLTKERDEARARLHEIDQESIEKAEDEKRERRRIEEKTKEEQDQILQEKERDDENQKWKERLIDLDNQRNKIINDFAATFQQMCDETSSELRRIDEAAKKSSALFEETLRADNKKTSSDFEEAKKHQRLEMESACTLLRDAQWASQIESQLCDRLFNLRNVHEPVRLRFTKLSEYLLEQFMNGLLNNSTSHQHALSELTLLREELKNEVATMAEEVNSLVQFEFEYPNAMFLKDIKSSIRKIIKAAEKLISEIEEMDSELKKFGDQYAISIVKLNKCQSCFEELEGTVEEIPTVTAINAKCRLF